MKDENEVGALWSKTGAKGEYLTGTVNGVAVVCFRNDRKTGKQPDWRVLKAKPRDEMRRETATRPDPNDEMPPF